MAVTFTGGALKMTVNLNAAGNIAQDGETASGTKTISFLDVFLDEIIVTAIQTQDTEEFSKPMGVLSAWANLLGATYVPTESYYNIRVGQDGEEVSKITKRLEAMKNGNVES